MEKRSLYQIRQDHLELLDLIERSDGELSPEIYNDLNLTNSEFEQKAVSYAFIIKHFDDNLTLIEAEIKRLQALQERAEKNKELLKQRLSEAMQTFGFEKITTPLLTLSFRKSESIEITNDKAIPEDYRCYKETWAADKAMIKNAIKSGQDVPGAQIVVKQNLQIR